MKLFYTHTIWLACLLLFVVAGSLPGCTPQGGTGTDAVLRQADTLMRLHADSAWMLLHRIEHPERLQGGGRALYALLYTQAQYKNKAYPKNDSLIGIAADYYSTQGDAAHRARAFFYCGLTKAAQRQFYEATQYFEKAADAGRSLSDTKLLGSIYLNLGKQKVWQDAVPEGLALLKRSARYALQARDTIGCLMALEELGTAYCQTEQSDSALVYIDEGKRLIAQSPQYEGELYWFYDGQGAWHRQRGELAQAISAIRASLDYDGGQDSAVIKASYLRLGGLYIQTHRYDSAQYCLDRGVANGDLHSMAEYHKQMSELELGKGRLEEAIRHQRQYGRCLQDINDAENAAYLHTLQHQYDAQQNAYDTDRKRYLKNISILGIGMAVLALLLLFCGLLIRRQRRFSDHARQQAVRQTAKIEGLQANVEGKDTALQEMTAELQLLKDQLAGQVQAAQQHSVKQQRLQAHILKTNSVIDKINAFLQLPARQKVRNKEPLLSDKEAQVLLETVNVCYNDFVDRLAAAYPDLSDDEKLLCCLAKIQINRTDMANILGIGIDALEKRKYRLKTKKFGTELSFDQYILSF